MPNPGLLTISGSDYGIVINNYVVYHNSSEIAIGFSKFFEKISEIVKLHQKSEAEDLCEVSGELLLESHSVSLLSAGGGVINLDLGLGAGGSDNNACVILEEESDNIGLRQGDLFSLAVSGGLYGSFVVSGCNYAQTFGPFFLRSDMISLMRSMPLSPSQVKVSSLLKYTPYSSYILFLASMREIPFVR